MPPGRQIPHTNSLPSAPTFIDLTEDDDDDSSTQPSNPDILHGRHPYAHLRRQARIPTPLQAEVIDLEGDNRPYQPPPFLQPDPQIGQHFQPRQWDGPEIQITGHQVLHPAVALSTSRPHGRNSSRHSSRHRPSAAVPRQVFPAGPVRTLAGNVAAHGNIGQPYAERIHRHLHALSAMSRQMGRQVVERMSLPGFLNYEAQAFSLAGQDPIRQAAPAIEPLPPARKGFVRAPVEDENAVPVCPNCEMELCMGDTELKKQVFVVKGCGHVYCGECAQNRHKQSVRGKGKEPAGNTHPQQQAPKFHTFTQCMVDGCTQTTRTKTSMVQIFL